MKRISLLIFAALALSGNIFAQNVEDALRYSQIFYGGTARFMSMGGAFTALGGDMSTLSQNPAGIGVFRSSEISITPQLAYIKSSADYNGLTSDYLYNFNLSQGGFVSNIISNTGNTGLITLNFGYSFNKTNNLHQSVIVQGLSPTSSMADYWAAISDGYYKNELSYNVPDARLAFDTWVIDTLPGSNTHYGTVFSNYGDNPPSVYGQNTRRLISYEGYTGEHAISVGGNYSNKLFFGATFGISSLKYLSHFEHLESTDKNLPSAFKNFTYTDHFENTSTGFSFKIGAIVKPVETLRIGLAIHAPTVFHIDEYFYEDMTSNFTDGGHYEFNNTPMRFNYALRTPFRALAGVAVQIKKIAMLSADYEFVDYSSAKFWETGDGYDYTEKNQDIKSALKTTSNFRLGGELRLNKLYLRSGYSYYGKAIHPGQDNANLDYSLISVGTGYRERNISIDFAYTFYNYAQTNVLYPLSTGPDPASVDYNLKTSKNLFTLTMGYKFGY